MIKKIFQSIKAEMTMKNMGLWFALGFVGVLLFFLVIGRRTFNTALLIETFGFAVVFVFMMIGTRSYSRYVDGFYQQHIDRENRKYQEKNKNKKKGSKKKKR